MPFALQLGGFTKAAASALAGSDPSLPDAGEMASLGIDALLSSPSQLWAEVQAFAAETGDNIVQLVTGFVTDFAASMLTAATDAVYNQLLKALTGRGFLALWGFAKGLVGQLRSVLSSLTQLLGQIGAAITAAASFSAAAVQQVVVRAFKTLTKLALQLLGALGLDKVKAVISRLICGLRNALAAALRRFLAWLKGKKSGKGGKGCKTKMCTGMACTTMPPMGGCSPSGGPTPKPPAKPGSCFPLEMPFEYADGSFGDFGSWPAKRLRTWLRGEYGFPASCTIPDTYFDPLTFRVFWFILEYEGGWVRFGLLRSLDWLHAQAAWEEGDKVRFDMEEFGVVGEAQLMQIAPCPVIEPGPGRVCTGWFEHSHGRIWELRLEGSEELIRGTGTHPVFSADRLDWVALSELKDGESVQVRGGFARVLSVTETEDVERVYTMEIDGDHCYRVGDQGILVHNNSVPCCTDPFSDGLQPLQAVTFAGQTRLRSTGVSGAVIPPATVMARVGQSGMHAFNRTGPPWWSDFTMANPVMFPDAWQRGHLLGSQLGGSGHSTWANMVPLHEDANKGVMVMCENRIAAYILTCGDCVTYSATPVYSGNNMHPNYTRPA